MIRAASAVLVIVVMVMTAWMFTGLPAPVASFMATAEFDPCLKRYNAARNARDTLGVDGLVLTPKTRFTREVTCGGLRLGLQSGAGAGRH